MGNGTEFLKFYENLSLEESQLKNILNDSKKK